MVVAPVSPTMTRQERSPHATGGDEQRPGVPGEADDGDGDPDGRRVTSRPGDGSLGRTEAARDATTRRWDDVTPAATRIGRAPDPESDLPERLRRLHDERHPAMEGHAARMHRLDKLRIAHAVCSAVDATDWERDRTLGLVSRLDLTEFGSRRAVATVALVTLRVVVDESRRERLGLHDPDRIRDLSPEEMEALYEEFDSLTDDERFRELLEEHDLDVTAVNRLGDTVKELSREGEFEGAAFGRDPNWDPNLPPRELLRSGGD